MFMRLANRLQEFISYYADSSRQKRPSTLAFVDSDPVAHKRPRLSNSEDRSVVIDEEEEEKDYLAPDIIKKDSTNLSMNIDFNGTGVCSSTPASCTSKRPLSNLRFNGYDFSEAKQTVSSDEKFSFSREASGDSNSNTHLIRPSLEETRFNHFSTDGDLSVIKVDPPPSSKTPSSVFKNWVGFQATTNQSNQESENKKKSSQTILSNKKDSGFSNLRKLVKQPAIRQCFRMEEKKKYKALLARYVPTTDLEGVDFSSSSYQSKNNEDWRGNIRRKPVGTNDLQQSLANDYRSSSPVIINTSSSEEEDDVGVSQPVTVQRSAKRWDVTDRDGSSRCSMRWSDVQKNSMERRAEKATAFLNELVQPSGVFRKSSNHDRSWSEGATSSTKSSTIIIDDDSDYAGEAEVKKAESDIRSKVGTGFRQNQWRKSPELINIDESSNEDSGVRGQSSTLLMPGRGEEFKRPSLRHGLRDDFEVSVRSSPFFRKDYLESMLNKSDVQVRNVTVKEMEAELIERRKMREEREALCSRKISNLIRLTKRLPIPSEEHYIEIEDEEDVIAILEEEEEDEFPDLTKEQQAVVQKALGCTKPDQVLSDGFRLQITARDIHTLAGLNWLNDEVINFYMNMIVDRSQKNGSMPPTYAFNTFFYPKVISEGHKSVRRWTKSVDIFAHVYVLVPVHLGMHWCLAVIDFSKKQVRYYDSMNGNNNRCLDALLNYLVDELKDKKQQVFDTTGWQKINVKDIPQQMNGSDCGMFACKFAEFVTRNAKISFNQSHMPYFRRRMVYEIMNKKLM